MFYLHSVFFVVLYLGEIIFYNTQNPLKIVLFTLSNIIPLNVFYISLYLAFFIVSSALLKIIILNANKEFSFYFSKIMFTQISKRDSDGNDMRYLIKALNSYNKYLRKKIGLQIKDLENIYSKILSDTSIDKNYTIKKLSLAFDDTDKFKIIKSLSELLNIVDTENFLTNESKKTKLEDATTKLGTIISIVTAIIGLSLTIPDILKIPEEILKK